MSVENGASVIAIRPLEEQDRERWNELWHGYLKFYETELPAEAYDLAWARLHDANEPMFGLGSFVDGRLVGIAHFLYHRSFWTKAPYCYLQDLFTDAEFRGRGIARGLIERVYEAAAADGAARVHWLTHETNTTAQSGLRWRRGPVRIYSISQGSLKQKFR